MGLVNINVLSQQGKLDALSMLDGITPAIARRIASKIDTRPIRNRSSLKAVLTNSGVKTQFLGDLLDQIDTIDTLFATSPVLDANSTPDTLRRMLALLNGISEGTANTIIDQLQSNGSVSTKAEFVSTLENAGVEPDLSSNIANLLWAGAEEIQLITPGLAEAGLKLSQETVLMSVTPEKAACGEEVTIMGWGFGDGLSELVVCFGPEEAEIIKYTSSEIRCRVPDVNQGEPELFTVLDGYQSINSLEFCVEPSFRILENRIAQILDESD